jgi:RecA-family ATPase
MAIPTDDLEDFFAEGTANDVDDDDRDDRERTAVREAAWLPHIVEVPTEWYAERPPKRSWLLRDAHHPKSRGVMPLGKTGQMIAEGGLGKTTVACQLAVAVATGTRFLGAFDVASPGRVLVAMAEEDQDEGRRKLYNASAAAHVRAPDPGSIVVLPLTGIACAMLELDDYGNLTETRFLRWIREYITAEDFRLVVIDPLSRFAGPKAEIDNAAGTRFIQALESLSAPERFVLNVHHTNKMSRGKDGRVDASSGRGSSALVDGARWQCALSVEQVKHEEAEEADRLGEVVTFAVTKSNYSAKPAPIALRRDLEHGGALVPLSDDDAKAVDAARAHDGDAIARQAAKETAKAEGNRRRDQEDDDAARQVIAQYPDAIVRELVAHVRKVRGCGQPRAHAAVVRVRSSR